MSWLVYLILAAATWAAHCTLIKLAGDKLPPAVVTTGFYVFSLLTVVLILLSVRPKFEMATLTQPTMLAIIAGAGITIGLTDFFFVSGLAKGAPVSVMLPAFCAGGTVLVVLIGMYLLGEAMTLQKLAGIAFACLGILLMTKE